VKLEERVLFGRRVGTQPFGESWSKPNVIVHFFVESPPSNLEKDVVAYPGSQTDPVRFVPGNVCRE
jgi:hypothetical protein